VRQLFGRVTSSYKYVSKKIKKIVSCETFADLYLFCFGANFHSFGLSFADGS